MTKAYCWRSGEIDFCGSAEEIEDGTIEIADSEVLGIRSERFRELINVLARHSYTPGVLLVPGIPEAKHSDEAMDVLERFQELVTSRLPSRTTPGEEARSH